MASWVPTSNSSKQLARSSAARLDVVGVALVADGLVQHVEWLGPDAVRSGRGGAHGGDRQIQHIVDSWRAGRGAAPPGRPATPTSDLRRSAGGGGHPAAAPGAAVRGAAVVAAGPAGGSTARRERDLHRHLRRRRSVVRDGNFGAEGRPRARSRSAPASSGSRRSRARSGSLGVRWKAQAGAGAEGEATSASGWKG